MAKSDHGKPARTGWSRAYEEAWEKLYNKKETDMTNKEKAEHYFAEELDSIKNKDIKDFALDVFEKLTPDYFWTVPCSTSGKYQPKVSLGTGGLIRHVKLAVWWGVELVKAMEMEKYHDEMVAALLLHDLIKNGKDLDSRGFPLERGVTGRHGVTLARKLYDVNHNMTDRSWGFIKTGIACHMGIWTTNSDYKPDNDFTRLIHLADYCASRKVDAEMVELNKLEIGDSNGSEPIQE